MLPTINGKEIIDCDLDDLRTIINNPDYAENEHLDYKRCFAIDEVEKEKKAQEQAEFRSDVCAFANSDGGYLFFGIDEKKGVPYLIEGIRLKNNNPDIFEREIKNYLQSIKPRMPYFKIKFIDMPDNKYVVIIYIQHDHYAPYIHLVGQKDYKIYKRIGNSKAVIEYQELKNMFTQSLSLEKEIMHLREDRINYFSSQEDDQEYTYSKFFLMHIIPDTFMDINYNQPLIVLEHGGARFSAIFSHFGCASRSIPTPEGLRYI